MIRPDVDPQLLLDLMAELGVRDHAEDRLLDDPVGVLLHLVTECTRPQTAGETRVAVGELLLEFVAADGDLVCVDAADALATVDSRRECRLVLATQQIRCCDGEPAEHHVRGVDDVPRTCGVTRLRRVRRHSATSPLSGGSR